MHYCLTINPESGMGLIDTCLRLVLSRGLDTRRNYIGTSLQDGLG